MINFDYQAYTYICTYTYTCMCTYIPILSVGAVWVVYSDHNEDVLELGPDHLWGEGLTALLLEYHRYNVITNVTFSQQLGGGREGGRGVDGCTMYL